VAASELLEFPVERGFVWRAGAMAARLDALLAFGRRALVELEAPVFQQVGLVLKRFGLRALGAVRGDDELLVTPTSGSRHSGLDWHRARTGFVLGRL
jgi:hypothetical protein